MPLQLADDAFCYKESEQLSQTSNRAALEKSARVARIVMNPCAPVHKVLFRGRRGTVGSCAVEAVEFDRKGLEAYNPGRPYIIRTLCHEGDCLEYLLPFYQGGEGLPVLLVCLTVPVIFLLL